MSRISRRAFLSDSVLLLTTASVTGSRTSLFAAGETAEPTLRVGLIADLHYADKEAKASRYYRETPTKLAEAITEFTSAKTDFIVELGDLIDAASSVETELSYLNTINESLRTAPGKKHYVLGNHCVDTLTKYEFLLTVGQPKSYYSFDQAGWHFVLLDACFNCDGTHYERRNSKWDNANVSIQELDWLRQDLEQNELPVIVFIHQRLDDAGPYSVKNAAAVRQLLDGQNVAAVFQGHSHKNDLQEIDGIHYVTLAAMIEGSGEENNAYSLLELMDDQTLRVVGFRKQQNQQWPTPSGDPPSEEPPPKDPPPEDVSQ